MLNREQRRKTMQYETALGNHIMGEKSMNEFQLIAAILRDLEVRISLLESGSSWDSGKSSRELLIKLDRVVEIMGRTNGTGPK